jgi:hypothetical protein
MFNLGLDGVAKYIFIAAAVVGGGWYINKQLKESNQRNTEALIDNSPEASQADSLYQMLHPYQGGALSIFENVDEKKVIDFAKGISNIDKVVKYYSTISKGKNLYDDLRFTLNESEYAQFKANIKNSVDAPKNASQSVIAAPTKGDKVQLWNDMYFKSPLQTVAKGVNIGASLKGIKYISNAANMKGTPILMYYVQGTSGVLKGKKFYVLQSQSILKK